MYSSLVTGSLLFSLAVSVLVPAGGAAVQQVKAPPPRTTPQWTNGPRVDENYFPIGVWLQNPSHAARYQAAGINLYVGLWQGPTPAQLAQLRSAGMAVICPQNEVGLANKEGANIVGWMHGDEPDNAQSLGKGKGYGPPTPPETIVADYARMRAADPTRPVMLNLGQGVAWDNWKGRGARTQHPEDYADYTRGGDIVSFDIYPATARHPEVAGKLEFVGHGAARLVRWTGGQKEVWTCIECTRIDNPQVKPTPAQMRSEIWMALIHGARGLIYFVHEFKPTLNEAALLDDPEMLAAVTDINRQIHELAPVLNSPSLPAGVTVTSAPAAAPIAWMLKRRGDTTYVFGVNLSARRARGTFAFSQPAVGAANRVIVRQESRELSLSAQGFADEFGPYQAHVYELRASL